jgi:hypothetical protein
MIATMFIRNLNIIITVIIDTCNYSRNAHIVIIDNSNFGTNVNIVIIDNNN